MFCSLLLPIYSLTAEFWCGAGSGSDSDSPFRRLLAQRMKKETTSTSSTSLDESRTHSGEGVMPAASEIDDNPTANDETYQSSLSSLSGL